MADPILYGPDYSTYVRTARLALAEKGVPCDLRPIDFVRAGMPEEQIRRHPFSKVPAFEHDGFQLYETVAITRYIDEAFSGPALQPSNARARARMTQIIAVCDSYAYQPMIWGIAVERLVKPNLGASADEATITAAAPKAGRAARALEDLAGSDGFLVDGALSLADLHLAPIYAYFTATPEGQASLKDTPKLARWWAAMQGRPAMGDTAPK